MTIFLCSHLDVFADGIRECWNCGGATTCGDGIPFPDPETGAENWCSEECWEEFEEFVARSRERSETNFCIKCGYDNHEHSLDCPTWSTL